MAPLEVTAFGNETVSWLGAHLELFRGQARPLGHRRGVPRGGAPLDLRVASLRLTRQLRESLIQRRGGVRQALGGAAPVGDHHDAAAARGHAARLVLAFAGHARGDAGRITLLAARCVTSRGTRQTKKKIGANKIEATSKKVFQSVTQDTETCPERSKVSLREFKTEPPPEEEQRVTSTSTRCVRPHHRQRRRYASPAVTTPFHRALLARASARGARVRARRARASVLARRSLPRSFSCRGRALLRRGRALLRRARGAARAWRAF